MSDVDRVVLLEHDTAEELLDLVADRPGVADEDRLDEALESIQKAEPHLPPEHQELVARGEAIALGVDDEATEALTVLIEADREVAPSTLRSIASTMKSKLKAASKKARRRDDGS